MGRAPTSAVLLPAESVRLGSERRAALSRGDEGARPRRRGRHERRRGAGGGAAADGQPTAAARTVARTVDLRDGRNVRAGRASRAASDSARSGVHRHRPRDARARHRPQHRDFLRRLRRALASAAVSLSRSPRLFSSAQQTETGVRTFSTWAPSTYEALRPRLTTFDSLAAYTSINAQLTGRGEPLQLRALDVSPNFFATLDVTLRAAGRS